MRLLRKISAALILASAVTLSSCHKELQTTSTPAGVTGVASWYGVPFNGRPTASGEIFDMYQLTAAHRTYPFGTIVRVRDEVNGKTVEVRINDRGPFVEGRIIDLSSAAAQSISMPSTATVQLDVVSMPATRDIPSYSVQVGSFAQKADATALLQRLGGRHGESKLIYRPRDQTWRVLVGRLPTVDAANTLATQVTPEAGPAFVVLLDED